MDSTEIHGKKEKREHGSGKPDVSVSKSAANLPTSQLNDSASSNPSQLESAPRKKATKDLKPEPVVESELEEDIENMPMDDEVARGSGSESEAQFEGTDSVEDSDLAAGDMPGAISLSLLLSGVVP